MIFKNGSGQGTYLFATAADGSVAAGDGPNITVTISQDGGPPVATATAHPTEIGSGLYWLPLGPAETDCEAAALAPVSATPGVAVDPVIFYTGSVVRSARQLN